MPRGDRRRDARLSEEENWNRSKRAESRGDLDTITQWHDFLPTQKLLSTGIYVLRRYLWPVSVRELYLVRAGWLQGQAKISEFICLTSFLFRLFFRFFLASRSVCSFRARGTIARLNSLNGPVKNNRVHGELVLNCIRRKSVIKLCQSSGIPFLPFLLPISLIFLPRRMQWNWNAGIYCTVEIQQSRWNS